MPRRKSPQPRDLHYYRVTMKDGSEWHMTRERGGRNEQHVLQSVIREQAEHEARQYERDPDQIVDVKPISYAEYARRQDS
jgi:hypothetical protein